MPSSTDIGSITTTSSALAEWLWRSAQLEAYAGGIAHKLSRSPLITAEERDYVGDVIHLEELNHRDILEELAWSCDVSLPAKLKLPDLKNTSDLDALMLLTRGEGALLLEIRKFERMLSDNVEAIFGFYKIVADERGHRRWSRRVVHRLHEEGRMIPAHVLRTFPPFWTVRGLVDAVNASL